MKTVQLTLTDEMTKLLETCKGHNLLKLKYTSFGARESAFESIYLSFDQFEIELSNRLTVADINGKDDYAQLALSCLKNDVPAPSLEKTENVEKTIGLVVTDIELITDTIYFEGIGEDWKVEIDVAIALKMGRSSIVFQKGVWFSEEIAIITNDAYEQELLPINQGWDFEEDAKASFKREVRPI